MVSNKKKYIFIRMFAYINSEKAPCDSFNTIKYIVYVTGRCVFCFSSNDRGGSIYHVAYTKHTPSTCFFRYPAGRHTLSSYRNFLFLLRPTLKNIRVCCTYRISNMISVCDTAQRVDLYFHHVYSISK